MRAMSLLCAGWLSLTWGPLVWPATYEVSQRHPQASDEGPGTIERPWKTLSHAAAMVVAGDTVNVGDGIYRDRVVINKDGAAKSPIRFQSTPGAHVVLTGADLLAGWQKADPARPVYRVPWPHRFNTWSRNMTHPGDEYHLLIGRCEQFAVDGYLLRQVLTPGQLAPGTFFADVTNQLLLAWDSGSRDLNRVFAEGSVRQEILRIEGAHVQVRGFHFRFAANAAQHGAVALGGRADVMEDCLLEAMNSSGAVFTGEDQIVSRCVFRDNGQLGFGANGAHRLLLTECLVENNNTKGFDRGWEAGGNKLVLTRDAVLERSRFLRNRGNGIWFDIGNENCTVRQCLIADNEDAGIFYEISFGLHVHDNVIVGNGFAPTPGAWGAQAGISLSSSPGCIIERNLIFGNREGFNFREQNRTTPLIGKKSEIPVWNHDELIRHNLIAYNRDAQVWGWFDINDNRHWPGGKPFDAGGRPGETAAKPSDIAAAYGATNSTGQPQQLSLETLRLRLVDNVYFAGSDQKWFGWGTTWKMHKVYSSPADLQAALGIDTGGRAFDPGFADPRARDFRLKPEAMSRVEQQYPRGPIPGIRLGIVGP
jgi:parallel beta-helix repeat protein